jgi:hypothetical protein
MVRLIRRCWSEFWLPAAVSDGELMAVIQSRTASLAPAATAS